MDDQLISFLNEKASYLENERLKAVKINYLYKIAKPIRSLLKVIVILMVMLNLIIPLFIPLTIVLGVILLLLMIFNDPAVVFEAKLKDDVLPTIFKSINKTFEYSQFGYNKKILNDSEILSKGFFANTIAIQGEDYVKGQIDNIDVEFFEISFFKEEINYAKTATGCLFSLILIPIQLLKSIFGNDVSLDDMPFGVIRDTNIFFSGFFMYADFHKDFKGKVLMIPKNNDRKIDKVYEMLQPKNLSILTTENPYFDNNYNIYASNSQLGYYVLSQSLIEKIQIIAEKEKALPIISFINGKMYFVIPWSKNYFKFNLKTKIENGNIFLPYIDEINSFEKIVTDFNLNTRIWSKI